MSEIDPLSGSWNDFSAQPGTTMGDRAAAFEAWIEARTRHELLPFDRRLMDAPKTWTTLRERGGRVQEGLNFATADYLGLASHEDVKAAAREAVLRFGTHSAGPASLAGTFDLSDAIAYGLAELLEMPHVTLHPSGWTASYGVMRAIIGPSDHVVLDAGVGNGLREGAVASTRRVHSFRHLDLAHLRRLLKRLRSVDPANTILVATASLFDDDVESPDLAATQALCREFDALLVVSMSHDVGCMGPKGGGEPSLQNMAGKLDIVVGSLSKTFASTGGFVATQSAAVRDYLRAYAPPQIFSTALGPAQLAAVHAALHIVRSPEGAARRAHLNRAVLALRAGLAEQGIPLGGNPAPIIPIHVGNEAIARTAALLCARSEVLVNLVEAPAAPADRAYLRLQVMAGHEPAVCTEVARRVADALRQAAHAHPHGARPWGFDD